jgi:hypothetical protein
MRLLLGDSLLPTALESGRQALVGHALRGFADRAGNADAVEQFLLGADLAQPLSSAEDKVWPAMRLVPVSPMKSFAVWSVW